MLVSHIRGLKYPDEHVIKFFFKEFLSSSPGRVLELGCKNGNNLSLFYQYGWEIYGVDLCEEVINDARYNFTKMKNDLTTESSFHFSNLDLSEFIDTCNEGPFDVILFPGCLSYLSIFSIKKTFQIIAEKKLVKNNGKLFLRIRSPKDSRYGKGIKVGHRSFQVPGSDINSHFINTFFTESEIVQIIGQFLKYKDMKVLTSDFSSLVDGEYAFNSDIIIWCTILNG